MKRKTDLCKAYQRGSCTWGSLCNHAHSEQEMRSHRKAYMEWKQGKTSASVSAVTARPAGSSSSFTQQVNMMCNIHIRSILSWCTCCFVTCTETLWYGNALVVFVVKIMSFPLHNNGCKEAQADIIISAACLWTLVLQQKIVKTDWSY